MAEEKSNNKFETLQFCAMFVLTFFVSYSLLCVTKLDKKFETYPLMDSIVSYVNQGLSLDIVVKITIGLAETTLGMFFAILFKILVPIKFVSRHRLMSPVFVILEYVVIFNLSIAAVHYLVFSPIIEQVFRLFISLIVLIPAVISAICRIRFGLKPNNQSGEILASSFSSFLKSSILVKLLFSALSAMLVVLFIAIGIEMVFSIEIFFGSPQFTFGGLFIPILIMLFGMSLISKSTTR